MCGQRPYTKHRFLSFVWPFSSKKEKQHTWVDETQDKNWWYRLHKNCEVIDDIHFRIQPYYKNLKSFTEEHTGTREKLIAETRAIVSRILLFLHLFGRIASASAALLFGP